MQNLSITTTLRRPVPHGGVGRLQRIKESVLGKRYDLSLVFVGDARSRKLNETYRKKDYATNVLSFPLDNTSGEIIIDVPLAIRESKNFDRTPKKHLVYLFIHGCLHLAGHAHGRTMDSEEQKLLRRFIA